MKRFLNDVCNINNQCFHLSRFWVSCCQIFDKWLKIWNSWIRVFSGSKYEIPEFTFSRSALPVLQRSLSLTWISTIPGRTESNCFVIQRNVFDCYYSITVSNYGLNRSQDYRLSYHRFRSPTKRLLHLYCPPGLIFQLSPHRHHWGSYYKLIGRFGTFFSQISGAYSCRKWGWRSNEKLLDPNTALEFLIFSCSVHLDH